MSDHFLAKTNVHHVWNRDLTPALEIASGDTVEFECHDSSGGQVTPASTVEDFLKIDRTKIHALTGPVFVEGAEPGDTLQIDVLKIQLHGWGWSSMIEGLGFLPDRFTQPFLHIWKLEENVTRSLTPAVVPVAPFCDDCGRFAGTDVLQRGHAADSGPIRA